MVVSVVEGRSGLVLAVNPSPTPLPQGEGEQDVRRLARKGGLRHDAQIGLQLLPAVREALLRVLIGEAGTMITGFPSVQFTGVATLCASVSCRLSITRSTSSKFRPVLGG